jgi:flagellar motor switch/type III secretory pathway protein FliN
MADDAILSQAEIDALLSGLAQPDKNDAPTQAAPAVAAPTPLAEVDYTPEAFESDAMSDTDSGFWAQVPAADLISATDTLLNLQISCSAVIGSATMLVRDVLGLTPSYVITLDQKVDTPIEVRLNGLPYARGLVVESGGRYAVRITEMLHR